MTTALAVQTSLIRQAAEVIDAACGALASPAAAGQPACPLRDDSLGSSAVAREVASAAARRVTEAAGAAGMLADLTGELAARLRTVADAFDTAETSIIAGPR